ncbi:MAG TPA: hypothetical protein VGB73_10360 [Pyrinomonadaceae bacterium]|jgi:hypothetical protein
MSARGEHAEEMRETRACKWRELSPEIRAALARKLDGLYGAECDERAFDGLAVDKQQALLIFARRMERLKLWGAVERVENVYGTGGVGMNFRARPLLASVLRLREDFSALWAAHAGTSGGFRERRRARATLHFLYTGDEPRRVWTVHFDLYNPLASLVGAWRHFYHESLRSSTPDWRAIAAAFDREATR